MDRSPELRDLVLRFYEALSNGDASFIDSHFSVAQAARGVGTDPEEWWQGPRVADAWKEQLKAMGGAMPLVPGEPEAYVEGTVGWVADRPTLQLEGGAVPARLTLVFHQEDGEWKLVQTHGSLGVPNEEPPG
ncbi:MAG: nuclear transport factor 2 family protein [Actinomycetota bacterium]|nr:nuclear transport factor 2 family protein [Actinomycetota bacterium]